MLNFTQLVNSCKQFMLLNININIPQQFDAFCMYVCWVERINRYLFLPEPIVIVHMHTKVLIQAASADDFGISLKKIKEIGPLSPNLLWK